MKTLKKEDMKYDVVALGELLIDFTQNGLSAQNNLLFEANPGGAPCNVLAILTKLGRKTAFIGKVGKDQFGMNLKNILEELSIGVENLVFDETVNTTLAFVHSAPDGDRSFSFYRKPGADMMLKESEIKPEVIQQAKVFHFGTLSMTDEMVRTATKSAIEIAQNSGAMISFDPNLREPLWESLDIAREQIKYGISKCDILKIAEEELEFVTGCKDIELGVQKLRENSNIALILVTKGKEGSIAFYKEKMVSKNAFVRTDTIDTTGAGDTFYGCVLNYILENGIENLTESQLEEMLVFANAAASIITTKKGALRVMPEREAILQNIGQ